MSQEQENQNEEIKVEKGCKSTCAVVLSIISLILSLVALGFTGWNTYKLSSDAPAADAEGKKVVISKQYDKGQSLDKAIASKKPIIAFFYTDWCGFCQRFVPTFHKVAKDKDIKKNFAIAYVNCEDAKNRGYVEEYKIEGFPTVYVITPDGNKVHLDNNRFFNEESVSWVKEDAMNALNGETKEEASEK